jgi:hypothetical protein
MEKIHDIIYHSTRQVYSVEDKLRIATIFIFCYSHDNKLFSELLYCEDKEKFIKKLNEIYKDFEVDFYVNLADRNIRNAFNLTLEKVKYVHDEGGFLKALFEGDEYALVIDEIANIQFDYISFDKKVKKIEQQLTLF